MLGNYDKLSCALLRSLYFETLNLLFQNVKIFRNSMFKGN